MGKGKKRFRLTGKLFMAFSLAAAIPLLAATVIYNAVFYSLGQDVSSEILAEKTQTAMLLFDSKRQALAQRLDSLSRENAVTVNLELGLAPSVASYLGDVARTERIDDITVWDESGGYFSSALNVSDGLPPPTYPQAQAMPMTAVASITAFPDGMLCLFASRTLNSGSGKRLGLLGARIGFPSLCRIISREISVPVIALDASLRVIASSGIPADMSLSLGPAAAAGSLEEAPASGEIGGKRVLLRFRKLAGPDRSAIGWIGTAYPADKLNAPRDRGALSLFIVMFAILGTCALLSVYFSRTITKPVRALAVTVGELARGSYGLTANIDQDDEIGDLAKGFNILSKALVQKVSELEMTRAYLDNVVNSLPSALVAVDRSGLVTQWNQAAAALAGTEKHAAIGRKIWELMPFLREHASLLGEVLESGEPKSGLRENVISGSGGDSMRYIDVSLFPLAHSGAAGAVYRFDDVTELERKENQLRQAQKMELLGNLTSGIAHDFNNILMGIMGTASLVSLRLQDSGSPDPAELKADIDSILSISERAKDLIKQLMGLSRRQEITFRKTDLNKAIDSAARICKTTFDKSILVSLRCPGGPAPILADPVLIEQVILNLCVNAGHAMTIMRPTGAPMGGKLEISLEAFPADERFCSVHPLAAEGSYWLVRISDTGVGIEPRTLPKIFDPFFTTKTPGQGSGLGLSTAYGIVRQHGGFIDVYSTPGQGSVFCVYLPDRSGEAPDDMEKAEPAMVYPGEGVVMVLDDEAPVRKVASSMLSQCGFEPVAVETLAEAQAALDGLGDKVKALILDMSMPGISGDEAFRALRARAPGLKVLVASGFRNDPRIDAILSEGALGYIQKPFTVYEFSRRLHEILF
jgi:two-component system cell cycle sensor histidine kinase/response regulator CckA